MKSHELQAAGLATALGTVLDTIGEYAEAEALLRRAVRAYETAYGPDDPRLAPPLRALGDACAARGRLAEAEALYLRVLSLVHRTQEES